MPKAMKPNTDKAPGHASPDQAETPPNTPIDDSPEFVTKEELMEIFLHAMYVKPSASSGDADPAGKPLESRTKPSGATLGSKLDFKRVEEMYEPVIDFLLTWLMNLQLGQGNSEVQDSGNSG